MFVYLLVNYPNPFTAGSERINTKERNKKERKVRRVRGRKGIEAQMVRYSSSSRATDSFIGNEEEKTKKKTAKREKQGAGPQPSYSGLFSQLLRRVGIIR